MPLIANHLAPVEHRDDSTTVEQSDRESMNDMSYESSNDIMNERNDEMESSSKKLQPPALPAGGDKRVSVLLENVLMDLEDMGSSEHTSQFGDQQSMLSQDPHESYLSSEEDASESADEYEGSLLEFDENGEPISPVSGRRSQEATARVVSITLVQKPQIVDIVHHSGQSSRSHSAQSSIDATNESLDTAPVARRRSKRNSSISISRRYSIASTISSLISPQTPPDNTPPPRKSSRYGLPALITKQSQANRNSDIFSAPAGDELDYPPLERPEWDASDEPKTPLSRPTSAWKRTLNRARHPSMPKMNLAYMNAGVMPGDLRAARAAAREEKEELMRESPSTQATPTVSPTAAEKNGPLRYGDIIKNAIRVSTPPAPPPPAKGLKASIFNAKRKSLKR